MSIGPIRYVHRAPWAPLPPPHAVMPPSHAIIRPARRTPSSVLHTPSSAPHPARRHPPPALHHATSAGRCKDEVIQLNATIERGVPNNKDIVFERASEQSPGKIPGNVGRAGIQTARRDPNCPPGSKPPTRQDPGQRGCLDGWSDGVRGGLYA